MRSQKPSSSLEWIATCALNQFVSICTGVWFKKAFRNCWIHQGYSGKMNRLAVIRVAGRYNIAMRLNACQVAKSLWPRRAELVRPDHVFLEEYSLWGLMFILARMEAKSSRRLWGIIKFECWGSAWFVWRRLVERKQEQDKTSGRCVA